MSKAPHDPHSHDHGHDHPHGATGCVDLETAMVRAAAVAEAHGEALTPLRRRVLELLLGSASPIKAYDLMTMVNEGAAPAKPPTVYRTLDFLIRLGLVHRIESLNAFVACAHDHGGEPVVLMVCDSCGRSFEGDGAGVGRELAALGRAANFTARRTVVEAVGTCMDCTA